MWYRRKNRNSPPRLGDIQLPDQWTKLTTDELKTPRMIRELKEKRYCEFSKTDPANSAPAKKDKK